MKNNLIRTMLFMLPFIFAFHAAGQLRKLGNPLKAGEYRPGGYYAACSQGNDLWVVYTVYDSTDSKNYLKIAKNNGLYWTEYHKQSVNYNFNYQNQHACWYKNDLYFIGMTPSLNALYKWNGSSVSYIDTISGSVYDMDTFKNKLVLSGNFNYIGSNLIRKLAQYDGSSFSTIGTPADWVNFQPGFSSGYNSQLVNAGNKLYISGRYSKINSGKPEYFGLAAFDGSNLSPVDSSEFSDRNFNMGEIYAHADSVNYYACDSGIVTNYCVPGLKRKQINSGAGHLYLSYLRNKFAYRGASVFTLKPSNQYNYNNTTAFIEVFTGRTYRKIYLPDYLRLDASNALGMFGKNKVFFQMKNTRTPGSSGKEFDFFLLDSVVNLSGTLSGKAYLDLNNDCVYNGNDKPLKHHWITLQPGNRTALTDENGNYFMSGIDSGSYQIECLKHVRMLHNCPSSGKYNILLSNDSNILRNFAIEYDSSYRDILLELESAIGWRARRGFEETYYITVKNHSVFSRSGTAEINFDNAFYSPVSSDSRLVFSGNKGTLTFTNLNLDEQIRIPFKMKTYTNTSIGSYKYIYASLDTASQSWDSIPNNDRDTLELKILAAYDPNDKKSNPEGEIAPGTRHIQYHINFQNVGNDTAYTVVIVDTIDLRLPLELIQIGSSSHPFKLQVKENILIFEFPDIKLVDSHTNVALSKGFVRFSAMLQPGLSLGSKVNNRAHIYFDYNDAIITNVASVVIADKIESISDLFSGHSTLDIYPNPGFERVYLINPFESTEFRMYNSSGACLSSGILVQGENIIKIGDLTSGIYIIVLGNGSHAKLIVQ